MDAGHRSNDDGTPLTVARFFPTKLPVTENTVYYDVRRSTMKYRLKYPQKDRYAPFPHDKCIQALNDVFTISYRLMTDEDISSFALFEQGMQHPRQDQSCDRPRSVSSSHQSPSTRAPSHNDTPTGMPTDSAVDDYECSSDLRDRWGTCSFSDTAFYAEYLAALEQPRFRDVLDILHPVGMTMKQMEANKTIDTIAVVSWLANPANVVFYKPDIVAGKSRKDHFPMYWTTYYKQMRVVAGHDCGFVIQAPLFFKTINIIVTNFVYGSDDDKEDMPDYALDVGNCMVGSNSAFGRILLKMLIA